MFTLTDLFGDCFTTNTEEEALALAAYEHLPQFEITEH